ncbi:unnamed protein product [Caenorhabditis auriculariae]|uniref:Uncharacterized protein n=1 Tax=Caenorhabditis auriculariae TaxID=2777116 RepID=A0A8S1HIS1_9PELO|nr:unnamed protein product [Caenorhabditis auriculariae]
MSLRRRRFVAPFAYVKSSRPSPSPAIVVRRCVPVDVPETSSRLPTFADATEEELRVAKKRRAVAKLYHSLRKNSRRRRRRDYGQVRPVSDAKDDDFREMFQHPSGMPLDADVMMEGYLYKRSSNAFKTWNRRWFQIKDNKLLYSHRSNEQEPSTVMEENLMLCLVRPAPSNIDRVGCFELVTPTRCHLLQADSESLCNDWMRALQRTILALHENDNLSTPGTTRSTAVSSATATSSDATTRHHKRIPRRRRRLFEQIRRVPGNEVCADCQSPAPKWVSINLGVVLCIECSGVHRSLGVQMSKVRSLTMDSIDNELRDVLLALGKSTGKCDLFGLSAGKRTSCRRQPLNRPVDRSEKLGSRPNTQEHLLVRHKNSIGFVNRSASYADVQEAESAENRLLPDPWSADLSVPLPTKRLSACGSETALDSVLNSDFSVVSNTAPDWKSMREAAESGDLLALLKGYAQRFELNSMHSGTTALHIATRNVRNQFFKQKKFPVP